jgi:hypothetical protein
VNKYKSNNRATCHSELRNAEHGVRHDELSALTRVVQENAFHGVTNFRPYIELLSKLLTWRDEL